MSNLATNAALNAKIHKVQNEIHNIINLATTAAVSHVENEIADVGNCIKNQITLRKYQKWIKFILLLLFIVNSRIIYLI